MWGDVLARLGHRLDGEPGLLDRDRVPVTLHLDGDRLTVEGIGVAFGTCLECVRDVGGDCAESRPQFTHIGVDRRPLDGDRLVVLFEHRERLSRVVGVFVEVVAPTVGEPSHLDPVTADLGLGVPAVGRVVGELPRPVLTVAEPVHVDPDRRVPVERQPEVEREPVTLDDTPVDSLPDGEFLETTVVGRLLCGRVQREGDIGHPCERRFVGLGVEKLLELRL